MPVRNLEAFSGGCGCGIVDLPCSEFLISYHNLAIWTEILRRAKISGGRVQHGRMLHIQFWVSSVTHSNSWRRWQPKATPTASQIARLQSGTAQIITFSRTDQLLAVSSKSNQIHIQYELELWAFHLPSHCSIILFSCVLRLNSTRKTLLLVNSLHTWHTALIIAIAP